MSDYVVAPFLISQCYNELVERATVIRVVAPFLISQCYNELEEQYSAMSVVAPFLISQCYNSQAGNPYRTRVPAYFFLKNLLQNSSN